MTRALDLPQNQIEAIFNAARKTGTRLTIQIGKIAVHADPSQVAGTTGARPPVESSPEDFESLEEYQVWRDSKRGNEGGAQGTS